MVLLDDILRSIEMVGIHPLFPVRRPQQLQKVAHKLARKGGDVAVWILADDEHLSDMALGLNMAFKPVFIATLFLADLAVPPETLEAL
jgi:hypothetical protein